MLGSTFIPCLCRYCRSASTKEVEVSGRFCGRLLGIHGQMTVRHPQDPKGPGGLQLPADAHGQPVTLRLPPHHHACSAAWLFDALRERLLMLLPEGNVTIAAGWLGRQDAGTANPPLLYWHG